MKRMLTATAGGHARGGICFGVRPTAREDVDYLGDTGILVSLRWY